MRIGTILHGALGDVYEQALAFKILEEKYSNHKLIAFFSREDRMAAFKFYELDMFDEQYFWDEIKDCQIDQFEQFQVLDQELCEDVFIHLDSAELNKFDFKKNRLPWSVIRQHNFNSSALRLKLSSLGEEHFQQLLLTYQLTEAKLENSVGYLWRYRASTGAVRPYFQATKERILSSKSDLFERLISEYGLNVIVAGMNSSAAAPEKTVEDRKSSGVLDGEINAKFASETLDVPADKVTYLRGLGYAAELEIIARTKFQLLMPSGFSEPIWMMNRERTLLLDPPPVYLLKMLRHRMPLFNNNKVSGFLYNNHRCHEAKQVLKELKKRELL